MKKRDTIAVVRDSKTGRWTEWLATHATVSDKGSVTIRASDALSSSQARAQLKAVKRIREAMSTKR